MPKTHRGEKTASSTNIAGKNWVSARIINSCSKVLGFFGAAFEMLGRWNIPVIPALRR
jgi:hypothetical protein